MPKVLITAPSLDERYNVSGISSIVREIVNNQKTFEQVHFTLGSTDRQKKNLKWIIQQSLLLPKWFALLIRHDITIVHFNTGFEKLSLIRDYIMFSISRRIFRKKTLLHIHGGTYLMTPPESMLLKRIIRSFILHSDSVVVLSEIEKAKLLNDYNFKKGIVLPNVVNISRAGVIADKAVTTRIQLCFLGRIVTSKGIFEIAAALKNISPLYDLFEFNVYGAGPMLDQFMEKLRECQGLHYSYRGVVAGDQKWKVLKSTDVFLLPSLYGEGLPVAMLEAMACECIVLVSNDASITSVVKHKVNGIVIDKNDTPSLEYYLKDIICHVDTYSALRKKAFLTIKEEFDVTNYISELERIYSHMLQ
jgi:glycosyltransferase involved in cell wall biosynthesis